MVLCIFIYCNVFLVLFLDLILGLPHYTTQLETLYLLIVFVPLFSLACMSRPTKNSVMNRHMLSPKYLEVLEYAIYMLKSHIAKVLIASAMIYAVRVLYILESI